jgi:hypothetical protein
MRRGNREQGVNRKARALDGGANGDESSRCVEGNLGSGAVFGAGAKLIQVE